MNTMNRKVSSTRFYEPFKRAQLLTPNQAYLTFLGKQILLFFRYLFWFILISAKMHVPQHVKKSYKIKSNLNKDAWCCYLNVAAVSFFMHYSFTVHSSKNFLESMKHKNVSCNSENWLELFVCPKGFSMGSTWHTIKTMKIFYF